LYDQNKINFLEDFMKNFVFGVFFGLVLVFCTSTTAWSQGLYKPVGSNENVIGTITTKFEAALGYVTNAQKAAVNEQAYIALLEAAKREHQGNIDVRDVACTLFKTGFTKNQFSASGKVISYDSGNKRSTAAGVEGALERAADEVSKDFSPRSRIAIVQITASDRSTRDYIIGELEYILQQQGYYMVDRAQLDSIFEEQRFGVSSDVDDNTAARMGKIAGASIVITGRVDGEGNLRRLRLRALNTETAQIVGTASERL
jgi:hypothetical protein